MSSFTDNQSEHQLPWLPDEHFELALHARTGVSTSPVAGDNVLTVTTRRAIRLGSETGKRTTSLVPLDRVSAVEIIDTARPTERLTQGLLVLGIGVVLGLLMWVLVPGQELLIVLAGGLPILIAVYLLAGYAFPDTEGELVLHTGSYALRQPLLTAEARRDAYLAAHRIYDLIAAAGQAPSASAPPAGGREGAAAHAQPFFRPTPQEADQTTAPTVTPRPAEDTEAPRPSHTQRTAEWPPRVDDERGQPPSPGHEQAARPSAWATPPQEAPAIQPRDWSVGAHHPAHEPLEQPRPAYRYHGDEESMAAQEQQREEMAPVMERLSQTERQPSTDDGQAGLDDADERPRD